MVSSFLPYPLFSGGHIRLYNILKNISKNNQVTLICEKRDYQTEQDIKEVKKVCHKLITVPKKLQWTISNILKSGFSLNPFLVTGHTNSLMREKISEELKQKFDLIHVETFYVMQNLPAGKAGLAKVKIPIILVEHNIEYLVYERFAKTAPFFIRPLLLLDVAKLKRSEKKYWSLATYVVAVSHQEKEIIERSLSKKVEVIPNGVDSQSFKMTDPEKKFKTKEKKILFIGDFRWIENRDSILWILKEIWPKIHNLNPQLKLWVVGKRIPKYIKSFESESINFDENAPSDTSLIYQNSFALLSPIRVGGGTSFKILEAMAEGVPVVTTQLGIEGIKAIPNIHVLISENSFGLANAVLKLKEPGLYKTIVQNAQKLIEEKYTWKSISKKLEVLYKKALL